MDGGAGAHHRYPCPRRLLNPMLSAVCLIDCGLKAQSQEKIMKGKVVLITGANGGLGTFVTRAFLDAGATVVGTSRKIQPTDFKNPAFTAIAAEISTPEGARVLVEQVIARFKRIDVLAHTVGAFAGGQSIAETDDA